MALRIRVSYLSGPRTRVQVHRLRREGFNPEAIARKVRIDAREVRKLLTE